MTLALWLRGGIETTLFGICDKGPQAAVRIKTRSYLLSIKLKQEELLLIYKLLFF